MQLGRCFREDFITAITDDPADKFAKTFVAKADAQNIWDYFCIGAWVSSGTEDAELLGAMITTISKHPPHVANLQLLHTFASNRNQGVGRLLCISALNLAIDQGAEYFRVSAEPSAVPFYERIGFKFLGRQKSKCQLSMFKIEGRSFSEGLYDCNDPIIHKAVHKKGKGGCVEIFDNC